MLIQTLALPYLVNYAEEVANSVICSESWLHYGCIMEAMETTLIFNP